MGPPWGDESAILAGIEEFSVISFQRSARKKRLYQTRSATLVRELG
jgi:hypothetical protein